MRAATSVETTASSLTSPSTATHRPATSKLFQLGDLYRIPLWFLAKPVYAFAPVSLYFRLAALRGTRDSLTSANRETLMRSLERHLGERTTDEERRRIARRHFQFGRRARFARLWPQIRNFAGAEEIEIDGLEHLDKALDRGKGAILITAHFGYMRMIKPILQSRGRNPLLVAVSSPNAPDMRPYLTRVGGFVHTRLLRLPRASMSNERWRRTLEPDFAPSLNVRPLLDALERNETVILLADGRRAQALQRIPVAGIDVFFAPGAVSIARDTGAPALPAFAVDEPGRRGPSALRLVIYPPLDLQVTENRNDDRVVNLRRFARVWEEQVRTHPHNWLWSWVRDGVFDRPH